MTGPSDAQSSVRFHWSLVRGSANAARPTRARQTTPVHSTLWDSLQRHAETWPRPVARFRARGRSTAYHRLPELRSETPGAMEHASVRSKWRCPGLAPALGFYLQGRTTVAPTLIFSGASAPVLVFAKLYETLCSEQRARCPRRLCERPGSIAGASRFVHKSDGTGLCRCRLYPLRASFNSLNHASETDFQTSVSSQKGFPFLLLFRPCVAATDFSAAFAACIHHPACKNSSLKCLHVLRYVITWPMLSPSRATLGYFSGAWCLL